MERGGSVPLHPPIVLGPCLQQRIPRHTWFSWTSLGEVSCWFGFAIYAGVDCHHQARFPLAGALPREGSVSGA